jgi:hypothetical protein
MDGTSICYMVSWSMLSPCCRVHYWPNLFKHDVIETLLFVDTFAFFVCI